MLYFRKGKSILLSDCLSRNPEYKKNMSSDLEDLETRLNAVDIEVSTYIFPSAIDEIAQSKKSDAILRDITEFIVHGWPEIDAGLPEDLQLYYSLRHELTYHADCVVKCNRVIIPLRETILYRLHGAHLGMSKMKAHAQERVYWPKMHRSIESFILRCNVCQEVDPKHQVIEPLQPHPIPGQPWSKLDADIFLP